MGYSTDIWIVKTDASGNIQWQNTIGGSAPDDLYSIQQTADGGYILGGSSWSNISGDKTENSNGGNDYWIVKTDTTGNILWQNAIGGSDHDILWSVQQTTDEGYILGGYSRSNISGDKTENCNGSEDYWIMKLTNKYNSITGKLFIDANSNNVQDNGEPDVINKRITEINTGMFAFSEQNGHYSNAVLDSGNFSVFPSAINYYNAVPATHNAYFPGIHQTDSLNDFAFQPAGVFNDLCVTITPLGNFRANMDANYMISYENVGTTTLNGTVIFFPDNDDTFSSSNPIATSVTTDSTVWNVGTLTPFQTGSILVTVHVNAGTPIGTLINSSVEIDPVIGDANTGCNYDAWEVYVTGAIDPNAIMVDRDTVLTTELSSPPYLNYIVYFQNTGNDTAFNVKVLNPIDTFKLQLNTLEFVASSHPVNMSWIPWERNMEFKFDNIILPDSSVNEPASHGFIQYRIKPKSTLTPGDLINNNAAIYFDFNQPVLTDTAVTEIVLPTGEESFGFKVSGLKLYPNPARNELIVNSNSSAGKKGELKIYDLFGREVFKSSIFNLQSSIKIDVSRFSQGVYFVQLQNEDNFYRSKFIKQ
ncbi:MAG: T9SS type A sorting domain-containing protein [Bacteroidia bacterium]